MSKPQLFFTGATGYIGGTVLHSLMASPLADRFDVVALVRDGERAEKVKEMMGVRPIVGSLDDAALLERTAMESDVVIHTANSADHVASAAAICSGLTQRQREVGGGDDKAKAPIYVHLSGAAVLSDGAEGERVSEEVYEDTDTEKITRLEPWQPHREVDLIVEALGAKEGGKTFIVMPPLIYGVGAGLFHRHSIQIPALIRAALKANKAPKQVGKGLPIWSHVHILDVGPAFVRLLEAAVSSEAKAPWGSEGYYFVEQGTEHSWGELSTTVGRALKKRGLVREEEPEPFWSEEEMERLVGWPAKDVKDNLGSNSRTRAIKLRELKWKPTHGRSKLDLLDSVEADVEAVLAESEQ